MLELHNLLHDLTLLTILHLLTVEDVNTVYLVVSS